MFEISKMSESERGEALQSLENFLSHHPDHVGALVTASELWLARDDLAAHQQGLKYLRHAYELNQEKYNFRMDRTLNISMSDSGRPSSEKAWAEKLKAQRPANFPLYVEYFDKLAAPASIAAASSDKQVEFYSQALAANPTNSIARTVLYWQLFKAKKFDEAIRTLIEGAELNPFANMMDWYAGLFELRKVIADQNDKNAGALIEKIDVALADFKSRYPQHADPRRIVSRLAIDRWLESDLLKIFNLVHEAHAQLMLQTYMPEKSGVEKPADAVIRKFANDRSLPLSDTSRYFFQLEPDAAKRRRFFTTWYGDFDNHLGENGYAVVAELLERDFEKYRWIPTH
jgi:tetratricopeptide (TPR) repeat protein